MLILISLSVPWPGVDITTSLLAACSIRAQCSALWLPLATSIDDPFLVMPAMNSSASAVVMELMLRSNSVKKFLGKL